MQRILSLTLAFSKAAKLFLLFILLLLHFTETTGKTPLSDLFSNLVFHNDDFSNKSSLWKTTSEKYSNAISKSEEVKEIAAFRVLFGGEEPSQVMQELGIHSIHTLNHWIAAYRKKIDQGLITLPPMNEKQKQKLAFQIFLLPNVVNFFPDETLLHPSLLTLVCVILDREGRGVNLFFPFGSKTASRKGYFP